MAITNLSLVNQKLAHARALLKMALQMQSGGGSREKLEIKALLDGAVFHLCCSYRHYLRELAEYHRVKNLADVIDESGLIRVLNELEKTPPEAKELIELRRKAGSWLFELHEYYHSLWSHAAREDELEHKLANDNLIPARILSSEKIEFDEKMLSVWIAAFEEMAARQRETTTEY